MCLNFAVAFFPLLMTELGFGEGLGEAQAGKPAPPNVLIIMGEDHAPEVCGAYGNAKAKTPNLDKFAATAMRFDRAYCNSPSNTPSRQALLTGRLPHSNGVTVTESELSHDQITLAHLLGFHGYRRGAFGTMHFFTDLPRGFNMLFDWKQAQSEIFGRGAHEVDESIAPPRCWRPFVDPASEWLNSAYLPFPFHYDDMPEPAFARHAVEYMREARNRPFLVFVGFRQPNGEFAYPVEFKDSFNPVTFDPPEPGPEDAEQIPKIFRDLNRKEKQGITASYYSSVTYMDACAGIVLDAVKELGLEENTVVVYSSDHGYLLGQHGWFEKQCLYEPAVRIPLIIRWPGHTKPGSVSDALAESIDLFPTIAEICKVPVPPEVEGKSLVPILEGKTAKGRESVFSEYLANEEAMIRNERYKLIYATGRRERKDEFTPGHAPKRRETKLFDLINDPGELRNLAGDPRYQNAITGLKRELLNRILNSHPEETGLTKEASVEEQLDLLLIPRERWSRIEAELRKD